MISLRQRLKQVRLSLQISQEALGAQGIISTPGWVKLENGQRQPSDEFLHAFTQWLEKEKYLKHNEAEALLEELLLLKYLEHRSTYVRELARERYGKTKRNFHSVLAEPPAPYGQAKRKPKKQAKRRVR